MERSPTPGGPANDVAVRWQVGESVLSTPADCVRKKLFDFNEDGEFNQWSSSSEYFSQSSHENSCNVSEDFSQVNLFEDSPSTKVCVCVCVCVLSMYAIHSL